METIDYTDLHTVYPQEPLVSPIYTIDTIVLSQAEVNREKILNFRNRWLVDGLKADFPYIRLEMNGKGIMMSDTPMERNTNRDFIQKANGDVIIFGLGLGLVIIPLLKNENVKSILVVELYPFFLISVLYSIQLLYVALLSVPSLSINLISSVDGEFPCFVKYLYLTLN